MDAIQNYQQVEQQYRQKYRKRIERQFKIGKFSEELAPTMIDCDVFQVKEDATPEEIQAVLNDDSGGQIFSQAVCRRWMCSDVRLTQSS